MVGLREPRGVWTQGKRAAERRWNKLWISWLNSSGMAAGWSHREFRRQIQWVWAPTEAKKKGKGWDFLFLVFCIFYSAELKTWTSNWRPIPQTQPKLNQEVNHWWKQRLVKVTSNISRDLKPKWRTVYYGVSKSKREKKEKKCNLSFLASNEAGIACRETMQSAQNESGQILHTMEAGFGVSEIHWNTCSITEIRQYSWQCKFQWR